MTSEEKEEPKKAQFEEFITFHQIGHKLLELVCNPAFGAQLCVYDLETGEFELRREYELADKIYLPYPLEKQIRDNHVFLPSQPKPYGSTIDLVNEIQAFLHTYVDYPVEFERLDAWYCLYTWVYELYPILPYRRALGDWGTGKTRWGTVLGSICRLAYIQGACATPAVLFRMCDVMRGTQIIDETSFDKKTDVGQAMASVLNSGYSKVSGVVYRCTGENNIPTPFTTFAPRLICARREFGDEATESRVISHDSYEVERDDVPVLLDDEFWKKALVLRNKLLQWRFDHYIKNIEFNKDFETLGLNPRLKEIFLPLISMILEEDVRNRLVKDIKELNRNIIDVRSSRLEASVLKAVLCLSYRRERLTVKNIAEATRSLEGIINEKDFTPRKCGWFLRKRLKLKVSRLPKTPRPMAVEKSQKNKAILQRLMKKFGITSEEIKALENERKEGLKIFDEEA